MKLFNKFFSKKWVYLYFVPLILLTVGFFFAVYHIFTYDTYYLALPIVSDKNAIIKIPNEMFKDGDVIRGEFTAHENNLGAVVLKIENNHDESVPDNYKVFFRFKEKGSTLWLSENSYNGGQFKELNHFPFGLPLISDSKNKRYVFEVTTKGVNEENFLDVDQGQKIISQYLYARSQFKDPSTLFNFISYKFIYIFQNIDGLLTSLIYFIPFYGYFYILKDKNKIKLNTLQSFILFIYIAENYIRNPGIKLLNRVLDKIYDIKLIDNKYNIKTISLFNILLFLLIIVDIFFIQTIDNYLLLIIMTLWILSLFIYKLRVISSYFISIFFLIITFFLILIDLENFAEKSAIWAYIFLTISVIHQLLDFRKILK